MHEVIRDYGDLVGTSHWDSDNPGAGAGVSSVYRFEALFFSEDDQGIAGPYKTFLAAAAAVGLLSVNRATISIWVDLQYRTEAEGAICLFDGLSELEAMAMFSNSSSSGR